MNDDMQNNPDNGCKNFEDRLRDSVRDWGSKTDMSILELLYGHYPDLTKKQFALCDMIISAIWSIGLPAYDSIVSAMVEKRKELFHNADQVETVIRQLIENGIIESKIHFIWFGFGIDCNPSSCKKGLLCPVRLLDLKNDIWPEAFMILSHEFATSVDEFFGPLEPEDQ